MLAAAALVLAPMAGVAVATPASAADDCPAHSFCLYPTSDYRDPQFVASSSEGCRNLHGLIDNNANAMRNYTDRTIILWDFPGCTGDLTYTARPESYDNNFHNNGFTDKASSFKRI
ncbi:peptidase inhibitor family I36 protein [Actinoplanes sp. NPDC051411]|uniref:peptidase inhibitor family I36 protein n=1 Tax=Actinoplanes sp. NPDC051411 TaxID=3155522 RepID=UPI0034188747